MNIWKGAQNKYILLPIVQALIYSLKKKKGFRMFHHKREINKVFSFLISQKRSICLAVIWGFVESIMRNLCPFTLLMNATCSLRIFVYIKQWFLFVIFWIAHDAIYLSVDVPRRSCNTNITAGRPRVNVRVYVMCPNWWQY